MDTGRLVTLAGGALVFGILFVSTTDSDPWLAATRQGGPAMLLASAVAGELPPDTAMTVNVFAEVDALGGGELGRVSASNTASDAAPLPVAAIPVRIGAQDSIMVIRKMGVAASDDEADAQLGKDAFVRNGPARTQPVDQNLATSGGTIGTPLPAPSSAVAGVATVETPDAIQPPRDRLPVSSEIEQTRLARERPPRNSFDLRRGAAPSRTTGATPQVASATAPLPESNLDSDGQGADRSLSPQSENTRQFAGAARRDDTRHHPASRTARERLPWETAGIPVGLDMHAAPKPPKQTAIAEPPTATVPGPSLAASAIVLPSAGGAPFAPRSPTPLVDAVAARDVIASGTVEQTVIAIDPRSRGTSGEWAGPEQRDTVVLSLQGARAVSDEKAALLAEPEPYAMIVGNSIIGFARGALWTEYFAPDGTIKGIWGNTRYVARWSMNGELMCFDYPGSRNYCLTYYVDGDQALFFRQDGTGAHRSYKLLAGNPYDL